MNIEHLDKIGEEVIKLRAELEAARRELERLKTPTPPTEPTEVMSTQYWRQEAWRAQKENAQLAAALVPLEHTVRVFLTDHQGFNAAAREQWKLQCANARKAMADSTALRDLLAPTIELLNRLDDDTDSVVLQESIKAELTRLRELCGEKGPAK